MTATMSRPELTGVYETVLYCDSSTEDDARRFYTEILGMREIRDLPFAYRVGSSNHVFLLFNRDQTSIQEHPPPHGATGPVHTCLRAQLGTYQAWKEYLDSVGVPTRGETTWGNGDRSFYFDDPAGNVLEIAEGDFWPD